MPVILENSGTCARIHLATLRLYGLLTERILYRGAGKFAWKLGKIFPDTDIAIIKIFQDREIRIFLNDGYWIKLFFKYFTYEPEIQFVLNRALPLCTAFLDCGANIGYWSIFASRFIDSKERIIAIEPSLRTFERLEYNSSLNNGAFTCIRGAVYSQPNVELALATHVDRHAGNSVTDVRGVGKKKLGYGQEIVRSVTIDRILERFRAAGDNAVVIKLDVEGAEIDALKGAVQSVENGALLIYEDHGQDPECKVTRFILDSMNASIYLTYNNKFINIENIDQMIKMKKNNNTINNAIAFVKNSPFSNII